MVVGDPITKKVKSWELSTKDDLFVVRSFPGTNKPKRGIIHCRTNDLKNNMSQSIAENILLLAKSSQQESNTVLVSSIVPKKDHLDKKR